MFLGAASVTTSGPSIDSLFFGMGHLIVEHFKLLQKKFEDYKFDDRNLKQLIDRHNLIFSWIEKLNNIYRMILLFQFLGLGLSVCMSAYVAIKV